MTTTTPRPTPEALWRSGADLTAAELSSLLEDCTGYTVESEADDDAGAVYFLHSPAGERLEPDYPFEALEDLVDLVAWRIDEALEALP